MDTTERLKLAYENVKAAELPAHLEEEALRLAFADLDREGSKNPEDPKGKKAPTTTKVDRATKATEATESVSEAEFFAELSKNLELPDEELKEIYWYKDGTVGLNLRGQDLGGDIKARTMEFSTLIAGAYRYGLGKPIGSAMAKNLGKKYQASDSNFSRHIRKNKNVSYTGPDKLKEIDLKPQGLKNYKELVLRHTGHEVTDEE